MSSDKILKLSIPKPCHLWGTGKLGYSAADVYKDKPLLQCNSLVLVHIRCSLVGLRCSQRDGPMALGEKSIVF